MATSMSFPMTPLPLPAHSLDLQSALLADLLWQPQRPDAARAEARTPAGQVAGPVPAELLVPEAVDDRAEEARDNVHHQEEDVANL